jgi:competence protein ComEC
VRCPAAIPAVALGAGIFSGIFSGIGFPPWALVCVWLGALGAFSARRDRTTVALLAFGFFSAGMSLGQRADSASRNQPLRTFFDRHLPAGEHQIFITLHGRLRTDASMGPAGVTLNVLVDQVTLNAATTSAAGGALIGVGGDPTGDQILQWRGGRRVSFPATLRLPTRYLDMGVPDAERQMAWRGTSLVGFVKSGRLVEVVAQGGVISEALASTRALVRRAVRESVGAFSDRSAAVVLAILIGDRAGLTDEVERRLQEAGTYHVIAISGGNIAILAGLFALAFRAIRIGARASALLLVALLTIYALAVEGGASVGRATVMAMIYFIAQACDHRAAPMNVAALAAAILFCVDPLQAVDAGFALTFGATLGIVMGVSRLTQAVILCRWTKAAAALLAATLCAEVALLPVNAFVFSRITFAGLLVNFAAIPMMTVAQVSGMIAVAASVCLPIVLPWIGRIAHLAVEGLVGSTVVVDWMPWLNRRLAPPSIWVIALYYGAVLMALARDAGPTDRLAPGRRGREVAVAVALVCGMWIVVAPAGVSATQKLLRVTFFDVGQGDSAIVQFPNGRTLSIDAGGMASSTFDIAGRVISPAFWALGVRRLDYMSVTHGDVDHIGGAVSLFRDFRPAEVWEGIPVPPHLPTRELRALADASGSSWRTLQPRDRMSFGPVDLLVHHPAAPDWERQRVRNDDSEVIEIRHGGVSFVFTGDIGREVERAIAPGFARAPVRILKVPHHGSASSSSQLFLDALRPDIAVISAGRGNPFGHPVPAVLDRYRDIGAAIYRTDHDGAITVETDGASVWVKTFTGRSLTLTTNSR